MDSQTTSSISRKFLGKANLMVLSFTGKDKQLKEKKLRTATGVIETGVFLKVGCSTHEYNHY